MKFARLLLFPFALLYDAVTSVRNKLFDLELKPSATFDVPVIGVGNLTVGGTGKTPMIEHLVRLLSPDFKVATLSRGYKRTTRGFRVVSAADSPATVGDEPFQFFTKFSSHAVVTVGEERAMAIPQIMQDNSDVQVVLLDDAFQHRHVKPHLQVLLSDYHRPFYKDFLLPAGNLRESRRGAERADVIVVTKCAPHISDDEMMEIQRHIDLYSQKPVFFTTIRYGEPQGSHSQMTDKVVVVSGLADPTSFEQFTLSSFKVVKNFRYPDHHHYRESDISEIVAFARSENASILATEKDWVKIKTFTIDVPLFYVPIEVEFVKNGKDFDEIVLNAIADASK